MIFVTVSVIIRVLYDRLGEVLQDPAVIARIALGLYSIMNRKNMLLSLRPSRPLVHAVDGFGELGAVGVLMSLQFDECWQQLLEAPGCLIRLSTEASCWCSRWRIRSLTNLSPSNNDLGPIPNVLVSSRAHVMVIGSETPETGLPMTHLMSFHDRLPRAIWLAFHGRLPVV